MRAPYTENPAEAFQIAQIAVAALCTLFGARPLLRRSAMVAGAWLAALWLAALAPALTAALRGLELVGPRAFFAYLTWSLLLLGVALLASRRILPVVAGVPVLLGVFAVGRVLTDFDQELAALHVLAAGYVLALLLPPWKLGNTRSAAAPSPALGWGQDVLFLVLGAGMAALVGHHVLQRGTNSGDEWAYTYQAAVYAKGQLHGALPRCPSSLRMFWVFWRDDRMFAQYQPGWPLFMVPFVWLDAIWLAGPASFGLLCAVVARLARHVVATSPSAALRAGAVAGTSTMLGTSVLLNGGSRYPHVFVAALFGVALLLSWQLGRARDRRAAAWLGFGLGAVVGWLALTRGPDAVLLLVGPGAYVVVLVLRGRVQALGVVAVVLGALPPLAFLFWSAHVQVGGWGVLPYQLTAEFYPWNAVHFSMPAHDLWKWAVPLGVGTYCWFPLAPALGVAGLALATREPALRRVAFTLALSSCTYGAFYGLLELGRGAPFGYGPRYLLVLVVPMALGAALLVERVTGALDATTRRVILAGAALITGASGCLLAGDSYPHARRLLDRVLAVQHVVEEARLKHAVVVVMPDATPYGPNDVTRNLPVDLYDPAVIYANDSELACLRSTYPTRRMFRASGSPPQLTPLE